MIGRRDREGPLMRNNNPNSLRKSRVLTAVAIGFLIGCVFAFLYPNGFFVSDSVAANRRLSHAGSITQVPFSSKTLPFCSFLLFQLLGLLAIFITSVIPVDWEFPMFWPTVFVFFFCCCWIMFDLTDLASFRSICPG